MIGTTTLNLCKNKKSCCIGGLKSLTLVGRVGMQNNTFKNMALLVNNPPKSYKGENGNEIRNISGSI